jgi:uncharacterized surface protein with fasciclin (FAS1) repeats
MERSGTATYTRSNIGMPRFMLTSAVTGPAGSAPRAVPGQSFLAAHSLGWAARMLAVYLGSAVAAMALGTGVLYVAHLVQPSDRWPDFRPLPAHVQNLPPPVQRAAPLQPPVRPADLLSDATPGAQGLVQPHASDNRLASIPGIVAVAPGSGQRAQLLAAIRAAASQATPGQDGPLTLFIPSDGAWLAGAAARQGQAGLSPQDRSRLHELIEQHVVPGSYSMESLQAEALTTGGVVSLKTLGGTHLHIIPSGSGSIIVRDDRGLTVAMAPASGQSADGLHVFHQLDSDIEAGSR